MIQCINNQTYKMFIQYRWSTKAIQFHQQIKLSDGQHLFGHRTSHIKYTFAAKSEAISPACL